MTYCFLSKKKVAEFLSLTSKPSRLAGEFHYEVKSEGRGSEEGERGQNEGVVVE